MTVYIDAHKILFVSAPKVACTSIKEGLFVIENGFAFRAYHANGVLRHIHDLTIYPAVPFSRIDQNRTENYLRLTMVRNPIKRFLSAYSNRVVYYGELSSAAVGQAALEKNIPTDPSLQDFIKYLEEYREISPSIRLHTEGLCYFLGEDPAYYNEIFDISQMQDFEKVISDQVGKEFSVPHLQTGGPKIPESILTDTERNKLHDFYHKDFKMFGEFWI